MLPKHLISGQFCPNALGLLKTRLRQITHFESGGCRFEPCQARQLVQRRSRGCQLARNWRPLTLSYSSGALLLGQPDEQRGPTKKLVRPSREVKDPRPPPAEGFEKGAAGIERENIKSEAQDLALRVPHGSPNLYKFATVDWPQCGNECARAASVCRCLADFRLALPKPIASTSRPGTEGSAQSDCGRFLDTIQRTRRHRPCMSLCTGSA